MYWRDVVEVNVDISRDGPLGRGSKLAAVVAEIPAHEDKGVWISGGAYETAYMGCCVAWRVEEEEGTVAEEVVGGEGASFQRGGLRLEVYFAEGAVSEQA